jgi:hypothetical protein
LQRQALLLQALLLLLLAWLLQALLLLLLLLLLACRRIWRANSWLGHLPETDKLCEEKRTARQALQSKAET